MLAPVLLDSESVGGVTSFLGDVRPGKYKYFGLYFEGTSAALVDADFGRIRVTERGRDSVNISAINLRRFMSLVFPGYTHQLFPAMAGTSRMMHLIPRGWRDENCQQVIETDMIQVAVNFGANWTTAVSAGVMELYGLLSDSGKQIYNLRINQIDRNIAANAVEPIAIRDENVIAVYLTDPAVDPTRIRILRDSQTVVDVDYEAARIFSDTLNHTESQTAAAATETPGTVFSQITEFAFCDPGEVNEFLSDSLTVEASAGGGGATNYEVVVFSADFTKSKLRQTMTESDAAYARRLARKKEYGRTRPIETLEVLATG